MNPYTWVCHIWCQLAIDLHSKFQISTEYVGNFRQNKYGNDNFSWLFSIIVCFWGGQWGKSRSSDQSNPNTGVTFGHPLPVPVGQLILGAGPNYVASRFLYIYPPFTLHNVSTHAECFSMGPTKLVKSGQSNPSLRYYCYWHIFQTKKLIMSSIPTFPLKRDTVL